MRILTPKQYKYEDWSGGTTTELLIYPFEATAEKKDFEIRISVATVDVEESDFTPFEGYKRTLTMLQGGHELSINGEEFDKVSRLKPVHFSGLAKVKSKGKATNFNVISRSDITHSVKVIHFANKEKLRVKAAKFNRAFYYVAEGAVKIDGQRLKKKDSFIMKDKSYVVADGNAVLIRVDY